MTATMHLETRCYVQQLKALDFLKALEFLGMNRQDSAFIFLRWFKLIHICIQVTSLHRWKKQGINHKIFKEENRFLVTQRIVSLLHLIQTESFEQEPLHKTMQPLLNK